MSRFRPIKRPPEGGPPTVRWIRCPSQGWIRCPSQRWIRCPSQRWIRCPSQRWIRLAEPGLDPFGRAASGSGRPSHHNPPVDAVWREKSASERVARAGQAWTRHMASHRLLGAAPRDSTTGRTAFRQGHPLHPLLEKACPPRVSCGCTSSRDEARDRPRGHGDANLTGFRHEQTTLDRARREAATWHSAPTATRRGRQLAVTAHVALRFAAVCRTTAARSRRGRFVCADVRLCTAPDPAGRGA